MASVVRDSKKRSPYWFACYRDATGRRLKKSTKLKNREDALRVALQLERAARLARSGELTEGRARELLSDLLGQITDGKESVRVVSIRTFMTGWLSGKRALLADGSAWSYENAVGSFLDYLGARADRPLGTIQTADLQEYVTVKVGEGLAPKTIEVQVKVLRSVLKAARLQQLITFNPAEAVQLPRGECAVRGTFTPGEVRILAESAPSEDWRSVILLGAYTGQRFRDCTNLEWRDVDFTAGAVTFKVMKRGGKRLTVPMHATLRAHLERIAGDKPEKYVAPSLANRETGGKSGLSEEFKGVMRAAGIEAGEADAKGRRKVSSRTFHSFRHGFISQLANAGVGEDLRMRLAGHVTKEIHAGYTHTELATLAAAIAKLPTIK